MGKKYLGFIFFVFCVFNVSAQLNVHNNNIAAQLAQIIAGTGVTISNVTTTCASIPNGDSSMSGSFSCPNCNLGLDSGIVLTNGLATNAEGPDNSNSISYGWHAAGDSDVANLIGLPVNQLFDGCALDFDVQVQSDSLSFNYVFGSDEYPIYTCSPYNDAFGFFISGPGITGVKNLALIPGTTLPVSINSVNSGTPGVFSMGGTCNGSNQSLAYPQYYVANSQVAYDNIGSGSNAPYDGSNYYIQYNDFTTVLTARIDGLQACGIYHLHLAISDVNDDEVDSGVFIQAGSLTSNVAGFTNTTTTDSAITSAVRGCVNGIFTVKFSRPVSSSTTVHYTIGGSAISGTDYNALSDSITFNTGDSTKQIIIQPKTTSSSDSVSVIIYLYSTCNLTVPYDSAVLYIVDAPPFAVTPHTSTLCPGDSVGLLATGANNYTWTPVLGLSNDTIANPTAKPATTTTYKCTSTLGTCTSSDTARVTVLTTAPFTVNTGPNDTSCNGTGITLNPVVTGAPVNGNAFVYTWSPATGLNNANIKNPVATPATPTEYVLQVASGNCKVSDSLKVVYDNISAGTTETDVTCPGLSNGTATANITGATPYSYHWSNTGTTQMISGLTGGVYTVTATDNFGCSVTASASVSSPTAIHFTQPVITNVTCFGAGNGSLTETATGGNGSFTYSWTGGGTTSTINNLTPNTYTITATDANMCTADTALSISQPAQLQLTDTVVNVACFGGNNGAINTGVTGGVTPYTFLWSNAATTKNITGLAMGTYKLTVTDFNNCTVTQTYQVAQPQQITLTAAPTNVTCFGLSNGAISVTVNGGTSPYTYTWTGGAIGQNPANLAAGMYTVTVTDSANCSNSVSATVSSPPAIYFNTPVINNVTCFGLANGSLTETATGGTGPFSYAWSNNGTTSTINNLAPNNYTLTATDANTCTADTVLNVTQPAQLQLKDTLHNSTCFGANNGSINIGITGGIKPYTFVWSNAATTQNLANLSPNNYSVTVTDSNTCTITQTYPITEPQQIVLTTTVVNASCFGFQNGSIHLTVTGGTKPYIFSWTGGIGAQNPANLAAGVYTVIVTDSNQCTATTTDTVTQPVSNHFNAPVIQNVSCFGGKNGSITITASGTIGNFTYAWSNGDNTSMATNLSAYIPYTVTAKDGNGCTADTTLLLTSPTADSISIIKTNVSCFGYSNGSATASTTGGTPGYAYSWNNAVTDSVNSGLAANNYTLTVTDNAGCTASAVISISQPGVLTATTIAGNVLCFGDSSGSLNLYVAGGTLPDTYLWSNGAQTQNLTHLTAGTYNVTVTDALLCTTTATGTVSQPSTGIALSVTTTNATCSTDSNGTINLTATGGTMPYTFSWNDGATSQNRAFVPPGNYLVTVTDSAGCTDTISAVITSPPPIHFVLPVLNNLKCYGAANGSIIISATGGTGALTYLWSNGDTGDTATALLANKPYTITATDASNCQADTTLSLTQPTPIILSITETDARCFRDSNGTATVSGTGGTGSYTYLWSNGQTTTNVSGLAYGGYAVTATDANSCTASTATAIGQPAQLTVLLDSFIGPTCTYNTNGYISASGNGGTTPYYYSLTLNGSGVANNTTGSFENLSSGQFTLTLTDSNNCSDSKPVNLDLPSADFFSITTNPTSCFGSQFADGSIHIESTTLQNAPYLYAVDGGNQQYDGNFYDLAAGPHQIVIFNYRGCETDTVIAIVQPAEGLAAILPGDTTLQLGQSIQLMAQFGPYPDSTIVSYAWSPAVGLSCIDCVAPLVTSYSHVNDYTVIITYNKTCTAAATAKIIVEGGEPVFIPNAFTPNGDGNNDVFLIYGTGIKTVDMKIFNRWGEKVFDSGSQLLGWDGNYKGALQLPGVYMYEAQITFLDDTKSLRTGSLTLIR